MAERQKWQTGRGKGGGKGGRSLCPFTPDELRVLYTRIPRDQIAQLAAWRLKRPDPPAPTTVTGWARAAGIAPTPRKELGQRTQCPFTKTELEFLYWSEGLLLREIGKLAAEKVGRNTPFYETTIAKWMRAADIPRRPMQESKRRRGIKRGPNKKKRRRQHE